MVVLALAISAVATHYPVIDKVFILSGNPEQLATSNFYIYFYLFLLCNLVNVFC